MLSTSVKIACGYILLVALFVCSTIYIYKQMDLLTSSPIDKESINDRRHLTHEVTNQLFEAELIGHSLCTGNINEYPIFLQHMQETENLLDSLKNSLAKDSASLAKVDTIRHLLHEKGETMKQVIGLLGGEDLSEFYRRQLDDLLAQQRSVIKDAHVRRQVETNENNYTTQHKKKKFFKRLAEVFVPGKADSTQVQTITKKEMADSIKDAFDPIDTIEQILDDVQAKVKQKQQANRQTLNKRIGELQKVGTMLSQRVNLVLDDIEREEQNASLAKLEHDKEIRERAAHTTGIIALTAIFLVVIFLLIIWRDQVRTHHYQQELIKAKLYAEDLLAIREKLMLTITHDIKAPVGSVIGYIDLLIRLIQDKRQLFYLQNMKSSARHLLDLVTSLLDYHRLDGGKLDLHPVVFNPRELFQNIYVSFYPLAQKKGLRLQFNDGIKPASTVKGDPFRIRQIAENLLSNALKFTEKGEIVLTVAYENGALRFSVKDSGCGISREDQEQIYNAFTRLRNAQGQEGFGLGLAITKKLVTLLAGTMQIDSEEGQGSTFSVELPLEAADPSESPSNVHIRLTSDTPVRILLIDDDRIQLNLTKAMIYNLFEGTENICAPTIQCCTPNELFALIREQHFDILFTDIQMPEMNGFELLKRLREIDSPLAKTIPVIAITARSDMHDDDFLAKGFTGRLTKPYQQDDFAKILLTLPQVKQNEVSEVATPETAPKAPNNEDFDFGALTAFSSGDEEAARSILNTFAEETRKNSERMKAALQQKDMRTLCAVAHKMLPTFTMIKANRAIPELTWLEKHRQDNVFVTEAGKKAEIILEETEKVLLKVCK